MLLFRLIAPLFFDYHFENLNEILLDAYYCIAVFFILYIAFKLFQCERDFANEIIGGDINIETPMIILRITIIFILYLCWILLILYIISTFNQLPTYAIIVLNAIRLLSLIGIIAGYIADIGYSLYQARIQWKRNSVRTIQKISKD